jgi:hypothetical protein
MLYTRCVFCNAADVVKTQLQLHPATKADGPTPGMVGLQQRGRSSTCVASKHTAILPFITPEQK